MKKMLLVGIAILSLLFGMAGFSQASLITIGTANYLGSAYKLIWDDNNSNSVVWLDFSNSFAHWGVQDTWASGLNGSGILTYNIYSAYTVDWGSNLWRLPTAGADPIANSEMGYLYYTSLGNSEGSLTETGDFDNLLPNWYWSGTQNGNNTNSKWVFHMNNGLQSPHSLATSYRALAIRTGQVSTAPIPEPATMLLFGTGLVGLAGSIIRKKKKQQ